MCGRASSTMRPEAKCAAAAERRVGVYLERRGSQRKRFARNARRSAAPRGKWTVGGGERRRRRAGRVVDARVGDHRVCAVGALHVLQAGVELADQLGLGGRCEHEKQHRQPADGNTKWHRVNRIPCGSLRRRSGDDGLGLQQPVALHADRDQAPLESEPHRPSAAPVDRAPVPRQLRPPRDSARRSGRNPRPPRATRLGSGSASASANGPIAVRSSAVQ